jgi:predicted nucleic acid-binding protein
MTEPGWLVDTNVLSVFISPNAPDRYPRLVSWVTDLFRAGGVAISAVTLYELRRGIKAQLMQQKAKTKAARLEMLLQSVSVLGLDAANFAAWNIAANLWAEGKAKQPSVILSEADLLIFASALAYGRRLATTDAHLVERIRDLGRPQAVQLLDLS